MGTTASKSTSSLTNPIYAHRTFDTHTPPQDSDNTNAAAAGMATAALTKRLADSFSKTERAVQNQVLAKAIREASTKDASVSASAAGTVTSTGGAAAATATSANLIGEVAFSSTLVSTPPHLPKFNALLFRSFSNLPTLLYRQTIPEVANSKQRNQEGSLNFAQCLTSLAVYDGRINTIYKDVDTDRLLFESFAVLDHGEEERIGEDAGETKKEQPTELDELFAPEPPGPAVAASDLLVLLQGMAWLAMRHSKSFRSITTSTATTTTMTTAAANADNTNKDVSMNQDDKEAHDDQFRKAAEMRMKDIIASIVRSAENTSGTSTTTTPGRVWPFTTPPNWNESNNTNDDDTATPNTLMITARDFSAWQKRNAPDLFRILRAYIYGTFCVAPAPNESDRYAEILAKANVPIVDETNSEAEKISPSVRGAAAKNEDVLPNAEDVLAASNIIGGDAGAGTGAGAGYLDIWVMSWYLPSKVVASAQWEVLFSGSQQGWALNRIEAHAFKYPGPTLLLLKISCHSTTATATAYKPTTIGVYVPTPWQRSKVAWGTDETRLFDLSVSLWDDESSWKGFYEVSPTLNQRNNRYAFYHPSMGFAFGGTLKEGATRLFVDPGLETDEWRNDPFQEVAPTFAYSTKGPYDLKFDIVEMEIWGLGGQKARSDQRRELAFEAKDAERRAHVNIQNKDVSRAVLQMAGLLEAEDLGIHRVDSGDQKK